MTEVIDMSDDFRDNVRKLARCRKKSFEDTLHWLLRETYRSLLGCRNPKVFREIPKGKRKSDYAKIVFEWSKGGAR